MAKQRFYVQDSLDGKSWRDLWLLGSRVNFSGKSAAREWWSLTTDCDSLDWKVGFLCRFRDGRFYRVVNMNSEQAKY